MMPTRLIFALLCSAALLSACDRPATQSQNADAQSSQPPAEQQNGNETERANAFFERVFQENLARSPETQTYLGIKDDYGEWDERTEESAREDLALTRRHLSTLHTLDRTRLDEDARISYDLMQQQLENTIADFKWRHHNYPVNQMFGTHTMVPALLINQHTVDSRADAEAYISRLSGVPELFDQLQAGLELRAEKGIIAPRFVFPLVIESSHNIIKGAPFDEGDDSAIFSDFKRKLESLDLTEAEHDALLQRATDALLESVRPAYIELIAYLEELQKQAGDTVGVWHLPEGREFYNVALQRTTTTDLTADDIHKLGLEEVARIHDEMRAIKEKVGFEGDLKAFMAHMKNSDEFLYPDNDQGREQYLQEAKALIDNMRGRLDEVFGLQPEAKLIVKRVEPFREKAAGKAFYSRPSADGSRPGTYYANLYDMQAMPTYQMEALAYHEGIPGHHMQIAIAQELEDVPKFRKHGNYTAYIEGWGLYSEYLPKEMGLYADPYSDFGRLAMELWRACRLVVDTGIHAKKWTRQEGIDYYLENTPNAKIDGVKMVDRHIVMPSQATAYKVGMLKILALREEAKQRLGEDFDIREFHDTVLKHGPVPLNVLEDLVEDWINSQLRSA